MFNPRKHMQFLEVTVCMTLHCGSLDYKNAAHFLKQGAIPFAIYFNFWNLYVFLIMFHWSVKTNSNNILINSRNIK